MPSYKAEAFARILNEAKEAKPLEGKDNVYSPEEYNKVIKAERLMSELGQSGEWLTPKVSEGDAEFDQFGRLKKIGRSKPAMLPLDVYTANRYMVEVKETEQEYVKKGADGKDEKATRKLKNTEIVVVKGPEIVRAITETRKLPPTVKAFRFRKTTQGNWKYLGAEFISSDLCYSMTRSLSPEAMFSLIQQMETTPTSTNVKGDSLEDIA